MTDNKQHKSQKTEKILVVADDLTGAVDTGVQFRKKKLKTIVITDITTIKKSFRDVDVVVADLETRYDDHTFAYNKAFETGTTARNLEVGHFYKKLDSTMRGNPGAEIAGLMDSLDIKVTFLAPALPIYGRITRDGKVFVNGKPLAETQYAKDPKNPVSESFIPAILSQQTERKSTIIPLSVIRQGDEILKKAVDNEINEGASIIIFDAETDDDLGLISSVITGYKERVMYAGCSGLAEKLVRHLAPGKKKRSNLIIAGSVNKITEEQIRIASEKLNLRILEIHPEKILSGKSKKERERIVVKSGEVLRKNFDLIIRSAGSPESVKRCLEKGRKLGYDDSEISEMIAEFLGETAYEIIRKHEVGGIVLTGGDTAIKALKALGVNTISICGEILHGIPYGHFSKKRFSNITVVTKAGGFGDKDAIYRIINFLRNE